MTKKHVSMFERSFGMLSKFLKRLKPKHIGSDFIR